ncbi:hypothetical protein B8W72_01685 [Pseudomonas putida]|uniref:Uncharacterized protein n=1 Tax=Pseudomonas putida TaxID=303 RepID=A0A1Y3LPG6_PSEPU|nr:hypothetical protein B8W72_01685 [Pseudomonas putida]
MASLGSGRLRLFHSWLGSMIRVDAIWLATEPMDMRAGTETALAVTVWPTHLSAHRPAQTRTGGKQSLARRYTH